jgi:uncharacterized protein YggE
MKHILILSFFIVPSYFAGAQISEQAAKPYIEVVGNGELEVIPNEIYVSFTLKERMDGKKKIEIESQEKELKKQLQKAGFDLANLTLADASADFVTIKRKNKEVLAAKNYIMKVTNTSDVASLFELLDNVNVLNGDITRVAHSEIEKYRKEVKTLAMKAAKEKAGYLLEAIGEKVGKPLMIQERENYDDFMPMPRMMANVKMIAEDNEMDAQPEISFQKIKLKYSIFARFEIQ